VVITLHDVFDHDNGGLNWRYIKWAKHADMIIVHSEQSRLALAEHGIRAQVVPVTLDFHSELGSTPTDTPKYLEQTDPNRPTAMLFGMLRRYKNLEFIADVWDSEFQERVRLVLVGASSPEVQQAIAELASRGAEIVDCFVPENEVDACLRAADILILPYLHGAHSGILQRAVWNRTRVLVSPALGEEAGRFGVEVVPLNVPDWRSAILRALSQPSPEARTSADVDVRALYETALVARSGH
jgi:glycosyltransferase involved in cell wall biosynthesis